MPANEHFRCPACRAKLKFGQRPKSRVTCPRCGHKFDYQAAEPIAQKAIEPNSDASSSSDAQEELGTTAAFGLALKEVTEGSSRSGADDELEVIDDEVADEDRDLREYRPLGRRPGAKKKPAANAEEKPGAGHFIPTQKSGPTARTWKLNPLGIGLVSAGVLMVLVLISAGVALFRNSGRGAAKFEPPEKYVALELGVMIPLRGMIPEGWKSSGGGGGGGRDAPPIFAKISDGGSISIEIRESVGLKLAQAATRRMPSLNEAHEYLGEAAKRAFSHYEESPARPIATEDFHACISDFSGDEGIFGGKVKGCRVSLVHPPHQYNVICKCPPAQFEGVKPVFEKIISSLGTGEKR
jgi:uncharacterized Zn finger protein (UPF0148 family)